MKNFNTKVWEELGKDEEHSYYVYCLVDPRTKNVFYVGKGRGNRVFAHEKYSEKADWFSLKLDKIREIKKAGFEVKPYIIRHHLSEDDALRLESVLIDLFNYLEIGKDKKVLLTNIISGHKENTSEESIMSVEEINKFYCEDLILDDCKEKVMFVNIGKTSKDLDNVDNPNELWGVTKGNWIDRTGKMQKVDYVAGVSKNIVRCIFKLKKNQDGLNEVEIYKGDTRRRFFVENSKEDDFEGTEIYEKYMNKRLMIMDGSNKAEFMISQWPVRYRNIEKYSQG